QPPAVEPLLRRYRVLLSVSWIPDFFCLLAALLWGGVVGLLLEQFAALIATRVYYSFAAIHTIRKAKWIAAEDSLKPVRTVALSLQPRRLRDYSSVPFELILGLLMLGALALLAHRLHAGDSLHNPARPCAFAALLVYLQLGGLLVKHGLVRWRMW